MLYDFRDTFQNNFRDTGYWGPRASDLANLGVILRKDPIHKQILATAKRLETDDDFDEHKEMMFAVKRRILI